MAITQNQRIIDLLYAGHPKDDVAALLNVHTAEVETAVQDFNQLPSGAGSAGAFSSLAVTGALNAGSAAVTGEIGAGSIESEGGIGQFGTEPPGAAAAIAGALSTVADAPAKAVLTSIVAALVATGQALDHTT